MLKHRFFALVLLFLAFATSTLSAQVTIRWARGGPTVEGGATGIFTAEHTDAKPRVWLWSIASGTGAALVPVGKNEAEFAAPMVVKNETFIIRVADAANPSDAAVFSVPVVPNHLFRVIMPSVMGKLWLQSGNLVPLVGDFGMPLGKEIPRVPFFGAKSLRYIDDNFMGKLNHSLIFIHSEGYQQALRVLSETGENRFHMDSEGLRAWFQTAFHLDYTHVRVAAIAVRPPDSLPTNPWHTVIAVAVSPYHPAEHLTRDLYFAELSPDGRLAPIMTRGERPGPWPP